MTGRALLIVDVQPDFCEGGSLAVAGGNKVAEKINAYVREHVTSYDLIVTSQDWHKPGSTNGGHIALPPTEPDYVDSWPVHCIQGSDGADLHDEVYDVLNWINSGVDVPVKHVYKGDDCPAYSAFEGWTGDAGASDPLTAVLAEHGITDVDVVGIATDHCVKASVLDALENDYSVTVLTEMTAGVDPERTAAALTQMAADGAEVI